MEEIQINEIISKFETKVSIYESERRRSKKKEINELRLFKLRNLSLIDELRHIFKGYFWVPHYYPKKGIIAMGIPALVGEMEETCIMDIKNHMLTIKDEIWIPLLDKLINSIDATEIILDWVYDLEEEKLKLL